MSEEGKEDKAIECLLNAVNECQETIRGYDTKAEILGILMTLVVGFLNFNLVSDYKCDKFVMGFIAAATVFAVTTLAFMLGVLFPSKNPIEEIILGEYAPRNTYFLTKPNKAKFNFQDIHYRLLETDWQKELLLELMKLSSIRDRKHKWFNAAVIAASVTFGTIATLALRIGYLCTIK
ncbi:MULTISPECIES: hypothetical protein [Geomonas]|uniref:hypothetical protein n=1 Tax=Geomonas TaxID=2651583 RepID=UPI00100A3200|nr:MULTISPECIES: hypothetical protein [Geomonas]